MDITFREFSAPCERGKKLCEEILVAFKPEPHDYRIRHDGGKYQSEHQKRDAPPMDLPVFDPAQGLGMIRIVYAVMTAFHIIYYITTGAGLKRLKWILFEK